MTARHYADAVMLAYLDDVVDADGREEIARHLETCTACRGHLDELEAWCTVLCDPTTWELVPTVHGAPDPTRIARFRETDDPDGRAALEAVRGQPVTTWPEALATSAASAELVRLLLSEARLRHDRAAADALAVIDLAASLVGMLTPPAPALEGDLWKERSNALRHLGRLHDALRALDNADAAYARLPIADYDLAFIQWARATVYFEMKRFADARAELHSAQCTFAAYGDLVSLAQIEVLDAGILFDEGAIVDARDRFEGLLPLLTTLADDETRARVYANLCTCELRLDMPERAVEHGRLALALLRKHGMTMEENRLLWSLGDALVLRGDDGEGFDCLRIASARFEAAGMLLDAAAVRVDMLEVLLKRGALRRARDVAAEAVAVFRREGADVDAAHALAYLHRAVDALEATPELARYVREHLAGINDGNRRPFAPPADRNTVH